MGLRELLCLVLAFLGPKKILADWEADDKNLTWVFDIRNPITTQNQTYKLNPETGAYRYHFDIRLVNSYKFETQSNDAVTLGCYGWKDQSDRWHTLSYAADSHGWRVIRNITQPIRVYPTFDHQTMRSFLDFLPQCLVFDVKSAPSSFSVLTNRQPTSPPAQSDYHDSHVSHGTENVHHIAPPNFRSRPGSLVNTDFGITPIGAKSFGRQFGNTKLESTSHFNKPQRTTTSLQPNDYGGSTSSKTKGGSRGSRPEARFVDLGPTVGLPGFKPKGPSPNSQPVGDSPSLRPSGKYSDSKKVVEFSSPRRYDASLVQRPKDVGARFSLGSLQLIGSQGSRSEDGSSRSTPKGSQPKGSQGSKSEDRLQNLTPEGVSLDLKPKSISQDSIAKGSLIGSQLIGTSLDERPKVNFRGSISTGETSFSQPKGGSRGSKSEDIFRNPSSEVSAIGSKPGSNSKYLRQEGGELGSRLKAGSPGPRAQISLQGSKPRDEYFHLKSSIEKTESDSPTSIPKGDTKAIQSKEDLAKQRTQTGPTGAKSSGGLTVSRPGVISLSPKQESNLIDSRPKIGERGSQSTAISPGSQSEYAFPGSKPFDVLPGSPSESDFPLSKQGDVSPMSRLENYAPGTRPIEDSPRSRPEFESSRLAEPRTEDSFPSSKPTVALRPEERSKGTKQEGGPTGLRPEAGGRGSKAIDIRPSSLPDRSFTRISPSSVFLGTRKESGISASKPEGIAPGSQLLDGTPGLTKSGPPISISHERNLDLQPKGPLTNIRSDDTSKVRDHSVSLIIEDVKPSLRPIDALRILQQENKNFTIGSPILGLKLDSGLPDRKVEIGSPHSRPKIEGVQGSSQKDRTPSSRPEISERSGMVAGSPAPYPSIALPSPRKEVGSISSRSDGGVQSLQPVGSFAGPRTIGVTSKAEGPSRGSMLEDGELDSRAIAGRPAQRQESDTQKSNLRGGAASLRKIGGSPATKANTGSIEPNTKDDFPISRVGGVAENLNREDSGSPVLKIGSGSLNLRPEGGTPSTSPKDSISVSQPIVVSGGSRKVGGYEDLKSSIGLPQESPQKGGSYNLRFDGGVKSLPTMSGFPGKRPAEISLVSRKEDGLIQLTSLGLQNLKDSIPIHTQSIGLEPKGYSQGLMLEGDNVGPRTSASRQGSDVPISSRRDESAGSRQTGSSPVSKSDTGSIKLNTEGGFPSSRAKVGTTYTSKEDVQLDSPTIVGVEEKKSESNSAGPKPLGTQPDSKGVVPGYQSIGGTASGHLPGSISEDYSQKSEPEIFSTQTKVESGTPASTRKIDTPGTRLTSSQPDVSSRGSKQGLYPDDGTSGARVYVGFRQEGTVPSLQSDDGGPRTKSKSFLHGLKPSLEQKSGLSQFIPESGTPGFIAEGGMGSLKPISSIQDTLPRGGTLDLQPGHSFDSRPKESFSSLQQGVSSPTARMDSGGPRLEYSVDSKGARGKGKSELISTALPVLPAISSQFGSPRTDGSIGTAPFRGLSVYQQTTGLPSSKQIGAIGSRPLEKSFSFSMTGSKQKETEDLQPTGAFPKTKHTEVQYSSISGHIKDLTPVSQTPPSTPSLESSSRLGTENLPQTGAFPKIKQTEAEYSSISGHVKDLTPASQTPPSPPSLESPSKLGTEDLQQVGAFPKRKHTEAEYSSISGHVKDLTPASQTPPSPPSLESPSKLGTEDLQQVGAFPKRKHTEAEYSSISGHVKEVTPASQTPPTPPSLESSSRLGTKDLQQVGAFPKRKHTEAEYSSISGRVKDLTPASQTPPSPPSLESPSKLGTEDLRQVGAFPKRKHTEAEYSSISGHVKDLTPASQTPPTPPSLESSSRLGTKDLQQVGAFPKRKHTEAEYSSISGHVKDLTPASQTPLTPPSLESPSKLGTEDLQQVGAFPKRKHTEAEYSSISGHVKDLTPASQTPPTPPSLESSSRLGTEDLQQVRGFPKRKHTEAEYSSISGHVKDLTPVTQTHPSQRNDNTPSARPKQYSAAGQDLNQTPKFEIPPGSSPVTTYIPPPSTNLKHFTTEIPHYLQPPPGDAQYCTCSCPRL